MKVCVQQHSCTLSPMNLGNEIRQFCSVNGLWLNRDLGQHYLIDQKILDAIMEAAAVTKNDHIVEIGAGIGILTRELLRKAKHVTAIEIDKRVVPLLHRFTKVDAKGNSLTVIEGNALEVMLPEDPYMIVANIPYHITSPLLRHVFLESRIQPRSLTLLIQREVAEKIADTKNAGMLTILTRLFGEPRLVTTVPPESFLPPPKVDSAVLHITCFAQPKFPREIIDRIFTLTKVAFGQKRKMLSNTLGALPGGTEAMEAVEIDPMRRPQTLSIDEWGALAKQFPK